MARLGDIQANLKSAKGESFISHLTERLVFREGTANVVISGAAVEAACVTSQSKTQAFGSRFDYKQDNLGALVWFGGVRSILYLLYDQLGAFRDSETLVHLDGGGGLLSLLSNDFHAPLESKALRPELDL